ncbi:hypothetical protein QFZ80_003005 [Paenibacillus sp. V4I7]|nr:hypothetical protein [Paenibacillus sp. V4I7]MDQ0914833.1 hypothetical protein [Paenibacillus sp. V4I5]
MNLENEQAPILVGIGACFISSEKDYEITTNQLTRTETPNKPKSRNKVLD